MLSATATTCSECHSGVADLFRDLPKDLMDGMARARAARVYTKKQTLFYEGAPISGIYCIQSGEVKVYKTGVEGKQHILRIARPGIILGLEALFTGGYATAAAEMIEEGRVCLIERHAVLDVIRRDQTTAMRVMERLAAEVVASQEERVDLAQSSVRERMARLLATLARSHGTAGKKGIKINLPVSREEMAEMIGTASETAMRLLKEFRDEKLVEVQGREITVLDRSRLIETARLDTDARH